MARRVAVAEATVAEARVVEARVGMRVDAATEQVAVATGPVAVAMGLVEVASVATTATVVRARNSLGATKRRQRSKCTSFRPRNRCHRGP